VLYVTAAIGLAVVVRPHQPALNQPVALRTATNTEALTWITHLGGPVGMTIIAFMITIAHRSFGSIPKG
jgi:hypothetical protein